MDNLKQQFATLTHKIANIQPPVIERVELFPDVADIRVHKNGKIVLNPKFSDKFKLGFTASREEGSGLDYFYSADWEQYPKEAPQAILLSIIKRNSFKPDTHFQQANTQESRYGATSQIKRFGLTYLIPLIEKHYGLIDKYIDLMVFDTEAVRKALTSDNGIYEYPGLQGGKIKKRFDAIILPLIPYENER